MDDVRWPDGLHQQGTRFYFRARVPADLIQAWGTKTVKWALETSDFREAVKQVALKRAEFVQRCDVLRAGPTLAPVELTTGDLERLAIEWFAERRRIEAKADLERSEPLTDIELDDVRAAANLDLKDAREALISRDSVSIRNLVGNVMDRWLAKRRITLAPESLQYRELALLFARAFRESASWAQVELEGDIVKEVSDPLFSGVLEGATLKVAPTAGVGAANRLSAPQSTSGLTVREAAQLFWDETKASKRMGDKTRQKYRASLDLVIAHLGGDAPIAALSRDSCKGFLELLRKLPPNFSKGKSNTSLVRIIRDAAQRDGAKAQMAQNTMEMYFRQMREFAEWAAAEGYCAPLNLSGLKVERRVDDDDEEDQRRAFEPEELRRIFSSPLFVGCRDEHHGFNKPGQHRPTDSARYWLPLLGLWTGARLGELGQLRVEDIKRTEQGTPYIDINADEPPMSLKTRNAARAIPIHPELGRLGFLHFVEKLRAKGEKWLFPDMLETGRPNSYRATKQFGSFLNATKLKAPDTCFHSFRHGFRKALREGHVPDESAIMICGWSKGGMESHYGRGKFADRLYDDICKVTYPGLDLSHLYPKSDE